MAEEDPRDRVIESWQVAVSLVDTAEQICKIRTRMRGSLSPYRDTLGDAVCQVLETLSGVSIELRHGDETRNFDFGEEPLDSQSAWATLPTFLRDCKEALRDPQRVPSEDMHVRAFTYSQTCRTAQ